MGTRSGQQIVQESFGDSQQLVRDHEIDSSGEAIEVAKARLEAAGMGYIVGQGSCIGNPDLRSRNMIELKGLGKRFSGLYYVTSTTHTINSSGYLTNFNVQRNAR